MSRVWDRPLVLGAMLALAAMSFVSPARAGIVLLKPTVTKGGDPFYIYDFPVYLETNSAIRPQGGPTVNAAKDNYLTIYDIEGLQTNYFVAFKDAGQTQVLHNWGATFQNTGITPAGQILEPDSPTISNVTISNLLGHPKISNTGNTRMFLGVFEIQSFVPSDSIPPQTTFRYVWQVDTLAGQIVNGNGVVPEPSTMTLTGLCLGTLGVWTWARRRAQRTRSAA